MLGFYCNKRFDISFSDFHKLIKLILPTNYESRETRGIYKNEYQPCSIIAIRQKNDINSTEQNIYCWLGQKGLTVLSDNEFCVSLCLEVLKEVKQNPEDYKVLSYDNEIIKEQELIELLSNTYSIYKQTNSSKTTSKYIIRENNNDEVQLDFYYEPFSVRLSGALTSLLTYVQLAIEKIQNKSQ